MNNKIRIDEIKWMNKHFTNYMGIVNREDYLPEVKSSLDSVIQKERERILIIIKYVQLKGFDEWAGKYHKKGCDCSLCLAFNQGIKEILNVILQKSVEEKKE